MTKFKICDIIKPQNNKANKIKPQINYIPVLWFCQYFYHKNKKGENAMKNINKEIGLNIANLREEKGLTQSQLAEKMGVAYTQIGNWERGERPLKTEAIIKIADFFNVSTDYLLGLTDIKSTDTTVQDICEYIGCTEEIVNKIRYLYTTSLVLSFEQEQHSKAKVILNTIFESNFIEFLFQSIFNIIEKSNEYLGNPKEDFWHLSLSNYYKMCYIFNINIGDLVDRIPGDKSKQKLLNSVDKSEALNESIDLSRYRIMKFLEEFLDEYDKRAKIDNYSTKEEWLNYFNMTEQEFYKFWGIEK